MSLPSIIVSHILRKFMAVGPVLPSLVGKGMRYNVSYGENVTAIEAAKVFYRTTYQELLALQNPPVKLDRAPVTLSVKNAHSVKKARAY